MLVMLKTFLVCCPVGSRSPQRGLGGLTSSITSSGGSVSCLVRHFDCLLSGVTTSGKGNSTLEYRVTGLRRIIGRLGNGHGRLRLGGQSVASIGSRLGQDGTRLLEGTSRLHSRVRRRRVGVRRRRRCVGSIREIGRKLRVTLSGVRTRRIRCLSRPVFDVGVAPVIEDGLRSRKVLCINSLVRLGRRCLVRV